MSNYYNYYYPITCFLGAERKIYFNTKAPHWVLEEGVYLLPRLPCPPPTPSTRWSLPVSTAVPFPEGPEWGAHGVWPLRVSGPPRSFSDSTERFSAALTGVPLSGGFPVTFPPTWERTSGWLQGLSIRNVRAHLQAVLWAELPTPWLNTKGRGRWVTCEPVSFREKPLNCLPQ